MANDVIRDFEPDSERLAVIAECMQNYDVGDADAEWPNNILSRRAVVYGSGMIARGNAAKPRAVAAEELALCRRLAGEAAETMAGAEVGMGSESGDPFQGFFVAGAIDESVPSQIAEALIRARFGGTIFPPATITVEPLSEEGVWWSEVEADGAESDPDYFAPWRAMLGWFSEQPEFVSAAFVRIGDRQALSDLPEEEWPEGTEITGCVLPRLALGLTRSGSLAGLFGYSVQS